MRADRAVVISEDDIDAELIVQWKSHEKLLFFTVICYATSEAPVTFEIPMTAFLTALGFTIQEPTP